jgi:hypothetical protein
VEGIIYGFLSFVMMVLFILTTSSFYQRIMEHIFDLPFGNTVIGLFAVNNWGPFCWASGSIVAAVFIMQFSQMVFLCCNKQIGISKNS